MSLRRIAANSLLLALIACDSPQPPTTRPAVAVSARLPVALPTRAAHPAPPQPHPVQLLEPDCPRPAAALMTIAGRWSREPYVPWLEVAFHAHPQFVLVDQNPAKPGEVLIESYPQRQKDDSDEPRFFVLVARCADADTCNAVATMFASVVPGSEPQTVCGANIPRTYGSGVTFDLSAVRSDDLRHLCARWTVCMRKAKGSVDPGPVCEKIQRAALDCAKQDTCEQVVACGESKTP